MIAEAIGGSEVTAEFVDRWRTPGADHSKQWEERFGEHAYLPLVEQSVNDALKSANLTITEIDHVIVSGLHTRAVGAARKAIGARPDAIVEDLTDVVGNTGTAHPFLVLAEVLERAEPNQTIALVVLADGCSTWILRTTEAVARRRPAVSLRDRIAATRDDLPYASFLTWRGQIHREPPRRPEPDRPAAPPSLRTNCMEVRAVRLARRGRVRPPAAVAGEHGERRDRPDGDRPDGRRAGDDRHVHDRPARLQPEPARRRRDHRLRRRRPVPVRADRRRSRGGPDRRPRRDDVPPPVHARTASTTTSGRHAPSGPEPVHHERSIAMASHGIKDKVAIVGMGCTNFGEHWDKSTDDMLIESSTRGARRRRRRARRRRRVLARDDGLGPVRADAQPPAQDPEQAGHPRRELLRDRQRSVPQRVLRGRIGRLRRRDGDRRREAEGQRLLGPRRRIAGERRHRCHGHRAGVVQPARTGVREEVRRRQPGAEGRADPHRVEEPQERRAEPPRPVPQGGARRRPSRAARSSPGRSASSTAAA